MDLVSYHPEFLCLSALVECEWAPKIMMDRNPLDGLVTSPNSSPQSSSRSKIPIEISLK